MSQKKLFFEQDNKLGYLYIQTKFDLEIEHLEKLLDCDYIKISSPTNISQNKNYQEIGPLNNFQSAWSSNAIEILRKCRYQIDKIEKTDLVLDTQYTDTLLTNLNPPDDYYFQNLKTKIKPPKNILLSEIDAYNTKNQLGFDENDILHYKSVFKKDNRHSLTEVELFDLSQSNSEHSRHWFFKGKYITPNSKNNSLSNSSDFKIDEISLFDHVRSTIPQDKETNSVLNFCDNASAIRGFKNIKYLSSSSSNNNESLHEYQFINADLDISYTAETHNFPTGISPFPGAATGVGGRIRDTIAIGKGGLPVAGIAGYSVGCLFNNPVKKPEDPNILPPEQILIQASNGASDYGNKFGEPLICGYTRSFGIELPDQRIEYLKPIMFSGGLGIVPHKDIIKDELVDNKIPFLKKNQKILFLDQKVDNIVKLLNNLNSYI